MSPDNATSLARAARPLLITFSGIDGAGKTTQIQELSSRLQEQGLRVGRLSFWDDVAVWSKIRSGVGHRAAKSLLSKEETKHSFSPKNNKHIRRWYLTAARSAFYLLDVLRLRRLLARPKTKNCDVVIFDRFIYDQLANIFSPSFASRMYGATLLKITPVPDLAFVLDASPSAVFARKPEYPLDFVCRNREAFLSLRELAPELIIVQDGEMNDVTKEIDWHVGTIAAKTLAQKYGDTLRGSALVPVQNYPTVQTYPTTIK